MKNLITLLSLSMMVLSFTACRRETPKSSLVGNWYGKLEEVGYSEIYFSDSMCSAQSQSGYQFPIKYYVKNDSIYVKDEYLDKPIGNRILKLKDDTLLIELNDQKIIRKELWIRLPKDEFGRFDLINTPEDSLDDKTRMNYDRRRRKFHAIETSDFREYDSLLKADYWKWNTKNQKRMLDERLKSVEDRLKEFENEQRKN